MRLASEHREAPPHFLILEGALRQRMLRRGEIAVVLLGVLAVPTVLGLPGVRLRQRLLLIAWDDRVAQIHPDNVPVEPSSRVARVQQALRPAEPEVQEELLPEKQSGGRGRFEKAEPTVVDGEDLDVPSFLRKKKK